MAGTQFRKMPRSRGARVPLRLQIAGLLAFFVAGLGFISISSTMSYLEENKTAQVREIQNLRVSRKLSELDGLWEKVRDQLTEQAFRLIDSSRGKAQIPQGWSWIKVGDKTLQAPGSTDATGVTTFPAPPDKREYLVSPSRDGKHFLIFLPLDIKAGQNQKSEWALAQVPREQILGKDASQKVAVQEILINASALKKGSSAQEVKNAVWMGAPETVNTFSEFFGLLLTEDRKALLEGSLQSLSREMQTSTKLNYIVSWGSLSTTNPALKLTLLTFVDRESLLKSFRSFVVKQVFYAVMILGFGFIFALFASRRLSGPIEEIAKAAKVLETGNFKARVKINRNDEIGDLGGAFNHMGKALEERENALQEAQNTIIQNEKLAAIGTLSAGIAHEVKNPLAGILGNADLVANQIKKLNVSNVGPLLNYIEVIQKETKRCRGIIDSLMKFSRQEKATFGPMDLEVVAWETIQLLEHSLNMSGVTIVKNFSEDLKMIEGNANQIEQTLLNMIQNGGHAMPQGGKITLTTQFFPDPKSAPKGRFVALQSEKFEGPFCRLAIGDTGTGMSDEVVRKIFEPFFTTKPKGVGTGLGLAVTLGILSEHKARISIDTAPGQGTIFYLDFMAKGDRSEHILHELDEIRKKAAGGAKVSTDISAKAPSGNTNVGVLSAAKPVQLGDFSGKAETTKSQFQGPPPITKSQFQGPPPITKSQFQGPPPITKSQFQGPPPPTRSQFQGPPSATQSQFTKPPKPTMTKSISLPGIPAPSAGAESGIKLSSASGSSLRELNFEELDAMKAKKDAPKIESGPEFDLAESIGTQSGVDLEKKLVPMDLAAPNPSSIGSSSSLQTSEAQDATKTKKFGIASPKTNVTSTDLITRAGVKKFKINKPKTGGET